MSTPKPALLRLAALLTIAAQGFFLPSLPAQVSTDDPGPPGSVVSIEASSPIAEESSNPLRRMPFRGRFTISRTGPTEQGLPIFVHYGGTARPGVDYPALPWRVTIPAGTNRIEIEVVPNVDRVPEPIETVEATLSECPPPTDPPMGIPCYIANIDPAHASARVYIRDDGVTTASLAVTAPADGAEFSEGTPIPIAAKAVDLEGAITHVDFFDDELKIGESTISFFRQPDPGTPIDHPFEWRGASAGIHSLTVRGLNAAGSAVTSAPVRIRVGEGLPVVSIEATVSETAEPSLTTRIRPGLLTLRRTGDTSKRLRVWMRYSGTARSGTDYTPLPTVVEFPRGAASAEVLVAPLEDEGIEGDETMLAEITPSPLGVPPAYRIDPVNRQARVVIHDSTPPTLPMVTLYAADPFAREAADTVARLNTATFVVRRAGPTSHPLEVRFKLGGSAVNGEDYQAIASPLTIPAGQRSARIVIQPIDDHRPEPVESVVVTLLDNGGAERGYVLGRPHRAAAIILDNDQPRPPSIRLPDGLFNVCVPMGTNLFFRVESTQDFKVWTPICTLPSDEGMAHFIDPDASASHQQFYRLVPVASEPGD
jgi:Bacterial Ig domain/Calx-beta domain